MTGKKRRISGKHSIDKLYLSQTGVCSLDEEITRWGKLQTVEIHQLVHWFSKRNANDRRKITAKYDPIGIFDAFWQRHLGYFRLVVRFVFACEVLDDDAPAPLCFVGPTVRLIFVDDLFNEFSESTRTSTHAFTGTSHSTHSSTPCTPSDRSGRC